MILNAAVLDCRGVMPSLAMANVRLLNPAADPYNAVRSMSRIDDGHGGKEGEAFRIDFHFLIEKYQGRMYSLALGMVGDRTEAEEVVQEALSRAYEKRDDLRDGGALSGWLGTIVRRVAIDRLRERKRLFRLPDYSEVSEHSPGRTSMELEEEHRMLWRAIRSMAPVYRTVFLLVHLEGLSYREAADHLDVPLSTIEGRIYKAKQFLRKKVSK